MIYSSAKRALNLFNVKICTLSIFFVTLSLLPRDIAYTLFKSVLFSTFKLTGNFKINSFCSPYTSKLALLNMETPYFAL